MSDGGISSGIKYVKLFLEKAEDSQKDPHPEPNENLLNDNYGTYASFTVPMGFKGKVQAEVLDNVGHTSGKMNADGSIVENSDIHKEKSSIEIVADNEERVPKDANNVPLYNSKTVPVTVTVTDTFSGIEKIEWYIIDDKNTDDKKQGIISVDINGKYTSDSQEAVINEENILRDANLVTKISFGINVTDNRNGNTVTVILTDRAGNTSDLKKKYSIDYTKPGIETALSGESVNDNYYNTAQTITVKITERNFNAQKIKFYINDKQQTIDDSRKIIGTDKSEYSYSFEVSEDGRYKCSVSYADDAGNTSFDSKEFVIDKTSPKITNNFSDFELQEVTDEEGNKKDLYFRLENDTKSNGKFKPIVLTITVEEVNFMPNGINVKQYRKNSGKEHTDSGWTETELKSWKSSGNIHTMTINIGSYNNGVYKFVIESAVDRAGNTAIFESPQKTDIFEVDSKIPVISVRIDGGNKIEDNGDTYISMYDYDKRNEESPSVTFNDDNIVKVEYDLTQYTPEYTSGKEIGRIEPKVTSGVIKCEPDEKNGNTITYKFDKFDTDGVYYVVLQAFDEAGNTSGKIRNTYVRMVDLSVLAYIEESDSERHTGWYSFSEFGEEGESRPISKRPDSFEDLKIVVFAEKDTETSVLLYDKNLESSIDTNITSTEDSCFDDTMYYFGAYRYILPSSYFSDNYKDDIDTNLYLRVKNDDVSLNLGEIYIDNTKPTYRVENQNVKNWGYIRGSGDRESFIIFLVHLYIKAKQKRGLRRSCSIIVKMYYPGLRRLTLLYVLSLLLNAPEKESYFLAFLMK